MQLLQLLDQQYCILADVPVLTSAAADGSRQALPHLQADRQLRVGAQQFEHLIVQRMVLCQHMIMVCCMLLPAGQPSCRGSAAGS